MDIPTSFLDLVELQLGVDMATFLQAMEAPPVVGVRLHPEKGSGLFPDAEVLPWSSHGRRLARRPVFTLDPLLHAGAYYVQDPSSQYLEEVWRDLDIHEGPPSVVLDLCAAPGGKSTHILSLLPPHGVLVANEVVKTRWPIAQENLWKWGDSRVMLTSADPRELAKVPQIYDRIVVDAPCSGEGLFRKDPDAIAHWSRELVALCSARQKRIIGDIWPKLIPGGALIYSTCTWNVQENEEVAQWATDTLGATWDGVVKKFWPQDDAGEGFSITVLRKGGWDQEAAAGAGKGKKQGRELPKHLRRHWSLEHAYTLQDIISVSTPSMEPVFTAFSRFPYMVRAVGSPALTAHGHLHPMAAHSTAFLPGGLPEKEVDEVTARTFLRRGDLPCSGEKGISLIRYQGRHLGFGKSDGHRMVSQYPIDFRIRMEEQRVANGDHLP